MEQEIILLAEAYNWDPKSIEKLPVSRRHRYLKMREIIVDIRNGKHSSFDTLTKPDDLGEEKEEQKVNLNYNKQPLQVHPPKPYKTGIGFQDPSKL